MLTPYKTAKRKAFSKVFKEVKSTYRSNVATSFSFASHRNFKDRSLADCEIPLTF